MKNKKGRWLIYIGLMMIVSAGILAAYNLYDANRAAATVQQAVVSLGSMIPEERSEYNRLFPLVIASDDTPAPEKTPSPSQDASELPLETAAPTPAPTLDMTEIEIPDYILNPNMDMPVITLDGEDYIGMLEIPELGLELPVISEWSYPRLKIAPCRYTGSAYTDNLVISAHNYESHFGRLKNLRWGDTVRFIDADGNVFTYQVYYVETLSPYDIDAMTNGEWDLTLFTCTVGGSYRVTVRCDLVNPW